MPTPGVVTRQWVIRAEHHRSVPAMPSCARNSAEEDSLQPHSSPGSVLQILIKTRSRARLRRAQSTLYRRCTCHMNALRKCGDTFSGVMVPELLMAQPRRLEEYGMTDIQAKRTRDYSGPVTNTDIWGEFALRSDDVIVGTPPKCGATWMLSIVMMLIYQ